MNTQLNVEAQIDALPDSKKVIDRVITPASGRENRNSVEKYTLPGSRLTVGKSTEGKLAEEGKKASRQGFVAPPTHAVTSLSSYKAQKIEFSELEQIWNAAKAELQKTLSVSTYETWIVPCLLISVENGQALIAVSSDTHRTVLVKRHIIPEFSKCLSAVLDAQITVKITVEPGLFPDEDSSPEVQTASRPKTQAELAYLAHIRYHNPHNHPVTAAMLEKYKGDIRKIIKYEAMFEKPLADYADGGWHVYFGSMINAIKDHTLDKVRWAIGAVRRDRSANDRGKLFFTALNEGLEDEPYGY